MTTSPQTVCEAAPSQSAERTASPDVALIIPCRNEESHITDCLDSLLANDYDHTCLEIVVVDGMSTDRTREILQEYCRAHDCLRMVDNPERITPVALNIGITATTAEIVMVVAAHSTYPANYISRLVETLQKTGADGVGAAMEARVDDTPCHQAIALAVTHPFGTGNAPHRSYARREEPYPVKSVFCGCYRRDVFERIGYFNERLTRAQDREFNDRLGGHGGTLMLDPSLTIAYSPRRTVKDYAIWMFRGGFWLFYGSRFTTTKMVSLRNLIPAAFVLWHVLALVLALAAPPAAVVAAAPVAAYWAVNLGISLNLAVRRSSLRLFPYLVVLFAATHYVYGVGSLAGFLCAKLFGRSSQPCGTTG